MTRAPHDLIPEAALAWHRAGKGAALATVIETWGSAPRQAGSQLAISGAGEMLGSVSGGCVEGAVITEALDALQDRKSRILTFGVSDETAFAAGLACGGTIRVLVEPVGDGAEALQIMRGTNIDIVFTDLTMQPLDGIDFVNLLRNSPDSPNQMAPVIMVTGHSTLRRIGEARDAGVNEVLAKPITARGVLSRINEVIENPRPFIRTPDYFGPERRRRADPDYHGKMRRATDNLRPPTLLD